MNAYEENSRGKEGAIAQYRLHCPPPVLTACSVESSNHPFWGKQIKALGHFAAYCIISLDHTFATLTRLFPSSR